MTETNGSIAIIGGTGKLGHGLGRRWAGAGRTIIIGSRSAEKAEEIAGTIGGNNVSGATNADAARQGDIVVITVPFQTRAAILEEIRSVVAGKIVVDTTVPLVPPKVMRVQLPPEGSAALGAQELLGEEVRVVSAFHNVAAHRLMEDAEIDCDILVFGDKLKDREAVVELADAAGLRGVHAGPLANSVAAEALTSILIGINKRYGSDGAGVRITGLDQT